MVGMGVTKFLLVQTSLPYVSSLCDHDNFWDCVCSIWIGDAVCRTSDCHHVYERLLSEHRTVGCDTHANVHSHGPVESGVVLSIDHILHVFLPSNLPVCEGAAASLT